MISNVHMTTPTELRFTANVNGISAVRFVFLKIGDSPTTIANKIADNLNRFEVLIAQGAYKPFDQAEHIAGILADASRYGCD
jgi:hypothetical protein